MKRLSISLAILLLCQNSYASVENFLKDSVTVSSSEPGFTRSQTRGVFSLGELKVVNSDIGSVTLPIKFSAPRYSAGCGGIDGTLGGFQFLLDEMVEKLKKIAAAAPTFAFQIALNFLCPECAQMMAQLEALANKLNSMNIDSCQGMQALGNWGANQLIDSKTKKEIEGNSVNTFMKDVTTWTTDATKTLNTYQENIDSWVNKYSSMGATPADAKKMAENVTWKGSFVKKLMEDYPLTAYFGGDKNEAELIVRSITGDIVRGQSDELPQMVQPSFNPEDINTIINGGGDIKGIAIDDNGKLSTSKITIGKGLRATFEEKLDSILTKMVNSVGNNTPNALSTSEKEFINAMPLPIYKILNTEVKKSVGGLSSDSIRMLSTTLASLQAEVVLSGMIESIYFATSEYLNNNAKTIKLGEEDIAGLNKLAITSRENISQTRKILHDKMMTDKKDFDQKIELLKYYADLDKEIASKLSQNSIYSRKALLNW